MRASRFFSFLCLPIFLSLCSCAFVSKAVKTDAQPQPTSVEQTVPPEISSTIEEATASRFKINPFDLLEITVYQEPDLNKAVRVSEDGFITFPLIGKVRVQGLDIIEAEQRIASLLEKDYMISPSVNVLVKEYSTGKVFVLGEVKNPGSYVIPRDKAMTVLEAIALAGGFSDVAKVDNTKVIRMENGVKQYINVKISDITLRGDKAKDIPLKPNDIVYISERIF